MPSYNAVNTHIAEYYQRHEKDKEGSKENVRDFLHSFIIIRSSAIQTFKGPTVYDWQRENENQGFDKRDNPYYKNGQNGVLFGEINWVFLSEISRVVFMPNITYKSLYYLFLKGL